MVQPRRRQYQSPRLRDTKSIVIEVALLAMEICYIAIRINNLIKTVCKIYGIDIPVKNGIRPEKEILLLKEKN